MIRPALLLAIFSIVLLGCSRQEEPRAGEKPAVSPSVTASVVPLTSPTNAAPVASPVSQVKSLPPEGGDIPRPGDIKGYRYTYKKDATKTVATFLGKLLPADNNLMIDAVRDVVERSYGDRINSSPRVTGSGPSRSMRVASKEHDYLIVVINNESGEIRALIITQMDDE